MRGNTKGEGTRDGRQSKAVPKILLKSSRVTECQNIIHTDVQQRTDISLHDESISDVRQAWHNLLVNSRRFLVVSQMNQPTKI